jgi:hypothetical protein
MFFIGQGDMSQTMVSETDQDFLQVAPIERDEKGRVKKGQALNPRGGQDRRLWAMKKKLDGLTPRALAALERMVDDESPEARSTRLGAAREILNRTMGVPRQQVQLEVTSSGALHLQALQELADRARQTIDITPNVQHDTDAPVEKD